jgi:predicted transcriptional regulator
MPRRKPPPALFELEAEVMEEMWRLGQATVREVLEELNRGPKQRAYTTVMTTMRRLAEKGLLRRRRQGKTDIYRPRLSREEHTRQRARAEVESLLDQYGDVALAEFAQQVGNLDARRLRQLRALADGE